MLLTSQMMEQAIPLARTHSFWVDEQNERRYQDALNRLSDQKLSWDSFLEIVGSPLAVSRLTTRGEGRTLLHLAVLEDRLDVVQTLKRDAALKTRGDAFGLSPIELAQFLNRKEALQLLQPLSEVFTFPDLPELGSFEYLPHPIFETREGLEQILATVAKAKQEDQIPEEKIWMGIYFDKEVRKGVQPPISIHHIDKEVGYGVFADKKIPACAYVGEYTGVVQQRKPSQLKGKRHCLRYTIWEGKKHFTIDAEQKGNFTRFINHSDHPNLGLQSIYWRGLPRMIFVALKEIREGEQLTFDYGALFWKEARQTPKRLNEI